MLIAAANVGGNYLQNHAVLALAVSECKLGKIDRLHLDFSRTHVNQSPIAGHKYSSFTIEMRSCWPFRAQHDRAAFGPLRIYFKKLRRPLLPPHDPAHL